MISVRIFSSFGTHTRSLYHNCLCLHWHSPSATPCNAFWFVCKAFRMSGNWVSSLLTFSRSSMFFSWIWCVLVVLSCMAVLQYFSLGRRVIFLCVFLASYVSGCRLILEWEDRVFPLPIRVCTQFWSRNWLILHSVLFACRWVPSSL